MFPLVAVGYHCVQPSQSIESLQTYDKFKIVLEIVAVVPPSPCICVITDEDEHSLRYANEWIHVKTPWPKNIIL